MKRGMMMLVCARDLCGKKDISLVGCGLDDMVLTVGRKVEGSASHACVESWTHAFLHALWRTRREEL